MAGAASRRFSHQLSTSARAEPSPADQAAPQPELHPLHDTILDPDRPWRKHPAFLRYLDIIYGVPFGEAQGTERRVRVMMEREENTSESSSSAERTFVRRDTPHPLHAITTGLSHSILSTTTESTIIDYNSSDAGDSDSVLAAILNKSLSRDSPVPGATPPPPEYAPAPFTPRRNPPRQAQPRSFVPESATPASPRRRLRSTASCPSLRLKIRPGDLPPMPHKKAGHPRTPGKTRQPPSSLHTTGI